MNANPCQPVATYFFNAETDGSGFPLEFGNYYQPPFERMEAVTRMQTRMMGLYSES
jgi:hypothetical protein